MQAMAALDRMLGPLSPNRYAQKTAPRTIRVLVFGASDRQGKSVAEFLIRGGKYIVSAIFEDMDHEFQDEECWLSDDGTGADADAAAAADETVLKKQQVRTLQGTLSDRRSYEHYLKDIDVVYLDANFWHYVDLADGDMTQAGKQYFDEKIACVEACVQAGVKQMIYMALDNFPEDKYVPHFHAKAKVAEYIRSTHLPTTFLYTSHAYSDFLHLNLFTKDQSSGDPDRYLITIPVPDDTILPGFALEQTGEFVLAALRQPKRYVGQDIHACGSTPTLGEMAKMLSKATGKHVDTLHLSKEEFYSEKHKEEVGDFFWPQYRNYVEGLFRLNVDQAEKIVPHVWSFKQWAAQSVELKYAIEAMSRQDSETTAVPSATASAA